MSSVPEVRPTEPADLPGLSRLFQDRFGHPLSEDEWAWKFSHGPGPGRSLVATDGAGEVLAHVGAVAHPATWPGGRGLGWQLVDFAGRSGGGLVPPVVRAGRALLADLPRSGDLPWIFGFPNARHYVLGERTFGYRPLPPIEEWSGPIAPVAEAGAAIEFSDRFGPWAAEAWAACSVAGVDRTEAFLSWRYTARPGRYYRSYRLVGAARSGLAVFGFVADEARATELWLPPGEAWDGHLRAVAADLAGSGFRRWSFWPPAGEESRLLLVRLGLGASGRQWRMGYRGPGGRVVPDETRHGFHYSMGDYDAS